MGVIGNASKSMYSVDVSENYLKNSKVCKDDLRVLTDKLRDYRKPHDVGFSN